MPIIDVKDDGTEIETFVGAVLYLREENLAHDSYFHAGVWDWNDERLLEIQYASTAYQTKARAEIDATREVLEAATAYQAGVIFAEWEIRHNTELRMGDRVTVTSGKHASDRVLYILWQRRSSNGFRYGLGEEGQKGNYLFVNDKSVKKVPLPVSEEDYREWKERAFLEARREFATAWRRVESS